MLQFFKDVALAVLVLLAPLKAVVGAVLVLTLIDCILGIISAKKQGHAIESSKLKRTVSKLFLYYSAIVVGFIAGKYLVSELIPIEKMISTLIGIVEVKSILENLDIINGGSFFKSLLDKLDKYKDEKDL